MGLIIPSYPFECLETVDGVNSDRSQRFATAEIDNELFGTCIFFKPRPRPSGLRRSDPDRDLPNYSRPSHFNDFPLLQWWPCSLLTEDCQVFPSLFWSCHPPVRFEPATPGKRGRSPILPTKLHRAVTHPITNAAILLNLSDLRGSHWWRVKVQVGTIPVICKPATWPSL